MNETREKVGQPGWRERLPLIERAVGSIRPGDAPKPARPQGTPTPARPPVGPAQPPHAASAPAASHEGPAAARTSRYAEIDLERLKELGILTPNSARSRIQEEFRVIKRGILQHAFDRSARNPGMPNNLVMVTSAKQNEGKTFTAVNLAISVALERDYTVLLVDGDFARPSVLNTLGLESTKGMIDILEDPSIDMADVMIRTNIDKLSVLPAGSLHNLSTELLASHQMSKLVTDIAQRYHDRIVIFDAPPILATSEPCALAMHVGQVIMVVEAEKTPKSAVKEALSMIDTGARIGVVLNRCSSRARQAQFGSYYRNAK